ncbi:MAG: hypothetical protein ACFFEY_13790 [Candidatus Thorarchaeota archaeon]
MEIETQRLIRLAQKRFSEILKDGFRLFIKTYGTIIIPLAFFQILLIILNIFILTDFRVYIDSLGITYDAIMDNFLTGITLTESEWNFLTTFLVLDWIFLFLQNLIGAIVITIAMCSVSNYVFKTYMKEDISFIESFKMSFNRRLFLAILILGVGLPLSSLLLFIPAIFIFGFFIFLVFTFNMESKSNPISEARAISKGAFLKIIGIFLINVILISIIRYFVVTLFSIILNTESSVFIANFNSWFDPITRNYGMIILYQILMSFIDIIFAPLFICLLTTLFSSLKARRYLSQEDYFITRTYEDLYSQQKEVFNEDKTQESKPMIPLKENFYCPFCGHYVSIPKKFCSKCGESFEFIK